MFKDENFVQVTTPVLFKLIPAIMHLGVLMHWFPVENVAQDEVVFLTEIGLIDTILTSHANTLDHMLLSTNLFSSLIM